MASNLEQPIDLSDLRMEQFDEDRFHRLMGDSARRAYSMALQLTRNASDAEDLVQDTALKAWRRFDTYIPGRPFLNWLLRIMQRAYLDMRRRENPIRKAESLYSMVSPGDGEVQEVQVTDTQPGPDEEAIYREFQGQLALALSDLPSVYREAIEMCDLEGFSYAEIAEIQRTTIGTVRSRIHRGRKLLRDSALRRGLTPSS